MKFKRSFLLAIFFLLAFVFLSTNVQAKDLVYEAHIGKNGDGQSYLTFRKYVRHYGSSSNTNWEYPNKLLSSQVSNNNGSYVTNAMIFHKGYGTNYVSWNNDNTVIDIGYDKNSKHIDTDETYKDQNGNVIDFFNYYGISSTNTWIKLAQSSNRWGSMGEYLETDLTVSKERIWNNIAITDFKAEGDTYKEIVNSVKENISKDGNWYKTMVSGKIKVKSYESGTKWDISTAQEMLDVMIPESTQAYYNGVGITINSNWTGNDFGYTEKETSRKLIPGYSVLNNFDNWLWIADPGNDDDDNNNNKEIYVNHFDSLGNLLIGAENPTQELQDENGNKITDIRNDTLSKKNKGGTWQEAYEINANQKLKVKNSDVIQNKTYKDGKYSYVGFKKRSFNKKENGDWELDSSKNSSGNTSNTSYTVGSNDSKITTIDFYYKTNGGGGGSSKNRKIYVNHLSTDGTKLTELANSSQVLLPDYTSIPNMKGIYNDAGYMEYYQIATNKYMLLKSSSKLNSSNRVEINGKWYKYAYYNTCAGSTLNQAYNSSSKLTNQAGSQFQIKHTEPITVVTFYYKPVDGTEDDDSGINIQGKLQFKSDYNLNSNNSEFVPVNNYLYPYISGAQKYILPNINEKSKSGDGVVKGDVIDKTETTKSYWDDYEEYRAVTVTGTSKGGDKDTSKYQYANTYTASSTTSSGKQPLKVYNGSKKNTLNIAGQSITLADYANTEGVDDTTTINGKEKGYVKYTTTYDITDTKTETIGTPPDTTTITTYYYTYTTTYTDPFTNATVISNTGSDSSTSLPKTDVQFKEQDVPVTYTVTLRKKWKLSHLYVYVIEDKTPEVTVNNGSTTGDQRGGVYKSGDSGINLQLTTSYLESVKTRLKTYYQDYNDTRRKIKSALQGETLLTNDSDFKTSDSDFKSRYLVGSDKYNGIRNAIATIQYKYYDLASNSNVGTSKLNHLYNDTDKEKGNERINIFTPLQVVEPEIKSSGEIVNQTGNTKYNSSIQRSVPFTFTPNVGNYSYGNKSVNTKDYLEEYYVKFDFNIEDVSPKYDYLDESGNRKKINGKVEAGTYIIIPKGGSITATAKDTDVGQTSNKIRVFASTINKISDTFVDNEVFRTGKYFYGINTDNIYMDANKITQRGSTNLASENITYNGNTSSMHLDARYITYKDASTSNIGRIYDFRVTDCTDIGFKNVFRNTNKDNDNKINQTNETSYFYSGTMHWTSGINVLLNRSEDSSILPLGPYKNSKDTTYIYAPKLGYRISYDVKTTGYLNNDTKFVRITPSYYYISKDGTTYLSDDDITLYYKTSSGNYKKFKDSGYSIQFKPNDGYRALEYDNKDNLSLKYCNLNISKQFKLLNKSMITISDDEYVQCWYGEFKLPNSTIAVKNNGGSINSPLTDGYIGVKFKIEAVEKDDAGNERILSYNNSDAGIDENNNSNKGINSTQWDYEGYLGYNYNIKRGSQISSGDVNNLQLEKGTWNISDQTEYEKVKGTVILYDIDNRAANDFE